MFFSCTEEGYATRRARTWIHVGNRLRLESQRRATRAEPARAQWFRYQFQGFGVRLVASAFTERRNECNSRFGKDTGNAEAEISNMIMVLGSSHS